MHTLVVLFLMSTLTFPNPLRRVRELQKEFFVQGRQTQQQRTSPWSWSLTGPEGGEIMAAVSNPNASNLAFASSTADVWRSTDGGATWELSFENCFAQGGMMSSATAGILVDGGGSVWLTLDAGVVWVPVLATNEFQAASFEVLDSIVYLVDSTPPRIWRSENSGLNWQIMGTINELSSVEQIAHIPSAPCSVGLIGRIPNNDTLAYILLSEDSGQTWIFVDTIVAGDEVRDFQQNPYNINHTLITTSAGIYEATSIEGPWTLLSEPFLFGLYQPVDIEFTGNDTILVSSIINPGIFRGVRSAGIWLFTQTEDREIAAYMNFGGPTTLYCGSFGLGVFKSIDDGVTWTIENNNLYAHTLMSTGNGSELPDSTGYFIGLGGTPYTTSDWGTTWTPLARNFLQLGSAIEVAPTDPDFLIVSVFEAEISITTQRFLTIFRSLDGGTTWTEVDSTYMPDDFLITSDPDIIIGKQDTFLIRSTAGGYNFSPILQKSQSLTNLTGVDTIFVATEDSTYVSHNFGATWSGLIDRGGYELAYDNTRKLLYIAGQNLYTYDLNVSVLDSILIDPYSISVSPNGNLYVLYIDDTLRIGRSFDGGTILENEVFPIDTYLLGGLKAADGGVFYYQPFRAFWVSNDITYGIAEIDDSRITEKLMFAPTLIKQGGHQTVRFVIDHEQHVDLVLYDISGRRVKDIFAGNMTPGIHTIEFATANLARGVYFITCVTDDGVATLKQIIY
jgi:hypothetical protein